MSPLLFVYGTLRDPELRAAVLGRSPGADAVLTAAAPGYATVDYPRRVYPGLIRRPGAAAPGLVLTDLTPFERDLLDAYEGKEYHREVIAVMIGEELHEAFAYLPATSLSPDAADWTLAHWQQNHKPRVLAAERVAANALRHKLIVLRPH